ncbi:MAG: hypothetical protein ACPL6C_04565 [bacterium]
MRKLNCCVRFFEPFSVLKVFLILGFLGGLFYAFLLSTALLASGKIGGGIAIPMGITITFMFWCGIRSGIHALLYNLFSTFLKGINLTLIEREGEFELKSINLWSLIRMFVPLAVIVSAFSGLAFGTIMKLANIYKLETPLLYYMPDITGAVLISSLLGLIISVIVVVSGAIYNLAAYIFRTGYKFTLTNNKILSSINANSIFNLSLPIGIIWGIITAFLLPLILPLVQILSFIRNLSLGDFIRMGIVFGIIWAFGVGVKSLFYNLVARVVKGIELVLILEEIKD